MALAITLGLTAASVVAFGLSIMTARRSSMWLSMWSFWLAGAAAGAATVVTYAADTPFQRRIIMLVLSHGTLILISSTAWLLRKRPVS